MSHYHEPSSYPIAFCLLLGFFIFLEQPVSGIKSHLVSFSGNYNDMLQNKIYCYVLWEQKIQSKLFTLFHCFQHQIQQYVLHALEDNQYSVLKIVFTPPEPTGFENFFTTQALSVIQAYM